MQAEEAAAMARRMVQVYADFATNMAAMPVVVGACPIPLFLHPLCIHELSCKLRSSSRSRRAAS